MGGGDEVVEKDLDNIVIIRFSDVATAFSEDKARQGGSLGWQVC